MMDNRNASFITKNDSKVLYGIAILFMIFHHCFCIPSRLNYDYIPVIGSYETEAKVAYIGKMCVAIYAFVSGYALAKIADKKDTDSLFHRFANDLRIVGRQLIRFYSKFWLVCLIFIPIGLLFFNRQWSFKEIVYAMLFGNRINWEWWYVEQYLIMILLFPIIDVILYGTKISDKYIYIYICVAFFLTIAVTILRLFYWNSFIAKCFRWCWNEVYSEYTLIFIIAILVSRFAFFEKIDASICNTQPFWNYAVIVVLLVIRFALVKKPADGKIDILLISPFIFCTVKILHNETEKQFSKICGYFGKYSTYMWLTHTFWIYYYFQKVILLPRYSLLIYIWAVAIALINAIVFDILYKRIETSILEKMKT